MLTDTQSTRTFLQEELDRRLKANRAYSLRSFARALELSPGELSELLRGKRQLSLKSAVKIARALGLNPSETDHWLELQRAPFREGARRGLSAAPSPAARQLGLDLFRVISDWQCFAILNLADCAGFKWDIFHIARRLAIPRAEVQIALERLERVGLIERRGRGYRVCEETVFSPSGIPSEAIRNYHRQLLAKAQAALDLQPIEEREFRGAGFALDPAALPALKKDISAFVERITQKYAQGTKTEVYHLELALFRLSERESK